MENQKRPSFQFFPGDWRRDAALQSCSVGARGLWIEMMCIMHDGTPYGHLRVGGKDILPPVLARMVGASLEEVEGWLEELEQAGVFSRTETGTIYSRRMVRDEEIRQKRAAGGVKSLENPNVPRPKKTEGYPSGGPSGDPPAGPSGGPLHLQFASASAEKKNPTPPPAAPARAHAREASAPAPAGNGGRQAAAPVSAPEWAGTAAQQDPERARLIGEMLAAVEERAREIEDERRRRRFVARSRLIVSGDDLTAWQDGTGKAAPWPDRPRLLRLALARTAGEEDPDLRAALRYTVAQQLDPFRPPKANAPPPGSEAARVRDELPRSGGTRTGDLERVGPAPYRPPDDDREERKWNARIERWEAEHPDEAKELLQRVAREIGDSPLGQGMAGEAIFRTLVRSKYRLEIRKLLEQAQTRDMAGAA